MLAPARRFEGWHRVRNGSWYRGRRKVIDGHVGVRIRQDNWSRNLSQFHIEPLITHPHGHKPVPLCQQLPQRLHAKKNPIPTPLTKNQRGATPSLSSSLSITKFVSQFPFVSRRDDVFSRLKILSIHLCFFYSMSFILPYSPLLTEN